MKITELFKQIRNEFTQIDELRKTAGDEKRVMTKEELDGYEKGKDKILELERQIEVEKSNEEFNQRLKEPFYNKDGVKTEKTNGEVSEQYNKAFRKWMIDGSGGLDAEQRTILGVDKDSPNAIKLPSSTPKEARGYADGGVEKRATNSAIVNETNWIPTELDRVMNSTKKKYAGWMEATTEIRTPTGGALDLPYFDDAAYDGGIEAEGTDAIASSQDLAATKQTLGQYWFSSTGLVVGWSELRDIGFPESEFIYEPLTQRLLRGINVAGTTGTGSSQPQGIVVSGGVGENVMADTAVTSTDMNNLLKDVDYAYHTGDKVGWMFSSSTMFGIAATVKSSTYNTEPLWQPSLAEGIPSTLYGYKYWVNNNMASSGASGGAGGTIMLFGDFSYQVNRWAGPLIISRLTERYAEKGQVGFLLSQYFDSETKIPSTSTYAPFRRMYEITT